MKRFGMLALCLGLLSGIAAAAGQDWDALGKRWWAHVQFLADDKLEGRNTGSAGFEKAATYVAEQFKESGLQPAGEHGYVQTVDFNVMQIEENDSSIELARDGKASPVKLGDEVFFELANSEMPRTVEAGAVFVGYGLSVPELKYDDFEGMDLKGKIAVYIKGGPKTMSTEIKAHYQSEEERMKALRKAGAVGVAEIPNPKAAEVPWSRIAASRLQAEMELSDKTVGERNSLQVALAINPTFAEAFFAGSGHRFQEVLSALEADKALPHFPLAVTIKTQLSVKKWKVKSENLAGILPGSDPSMSKEYVVISAHLDHLGIGEPVNGDKIYNGAMDDASGIASLLEVARRMHESGARPKRSILFLTVTAEEKGLLGSSYFVEHPTVKRKSIAADLNMDMYLPLFPLKYLEVQGLNESTLGEDIRAACAEAGVQVQADKQPDHNRFIRSDQYSFIRKGVPALAFKFGWVPGTPEEKKFNDWYKERYHGPADDLTQPVDKEGAAQFTAILEKLALRIANDPQRPAWKADSFFKRFAQ